MVPSFLKKHTDLISTRRAKSEDQEYVTEEDILSFYGVIKSYMKNQDLPDALNNSRRIFNADESEFYLQPKTERVIVRKGRKMSIQH